MNGLYTERENILPHHAEWLDRCGATWCGVDEIFSAHKPKDTNIVFNGMARNQFTTTSYPEDYTHTPTALEFCQGVARIIGIPEPTFDDEPKTGPKKLGVSALPASPVYLHEGKQFPEPTIPKTGTVEPIKGMAIEYKLLSSDEKRWLYDEIEAWEPGMEYILFDPKEKSFNGFSKVYVNKHLYTITDSPKVFMEYVAQQTGKEYKVEGATEKDIGMMNQCNRHQAVTSGTNDPPNVTHGTPRTSGDYFLDPKKEGDQFQSSNHPILYPHKTYRILDSLDDIPLDKRFKLSEWIPPYGVEVAIIHTLGNMFAEFESIDSKGLRFQNEHDKYLVADGEWMRIV